MSVRYAEPGSTENDSSSPSKTVTVEVNIMDEGAFECAVWALVRRSCDPLRRPIGTVLVTTEHCWSGYSEFTITSTWEQVVLTAPEVDWEQTWDTMPAFFKALSDAVDAADE